jgi:hypothetical protein
MPCQGFRYEELDDVKVCPVRFGSGKQIKTTSANRDAERKVRSAWRDQKQFATVPYRGNEPLWLRHLQRLRFVVWRARPEKDIMVLWCGKFAAARRRGQTHCKVTPQRHRFCW